MQKSWQEYVTIPTRFYTLQKRISRLQSKKIVTHHCGILFYSLVIIFSVPYQQFSRKAADFFVAVSVSWALALKITSLRHSEDYCDLGLELKDSISFLSYSFRRITIDGSVLKNNVKIMHSANVLDPPLLRKEISKLCAF